jgi:flagellar hook-associated protein 3 FlgL
MTRISENQAHRRLIDNAIEKKRQVDQYSNEISSGYKVVTPGDSDVSGTIARYRQTLDKIDTYTTTITQSRSVLEFQDDVMNQMNDLLVRAKEIASQAANETHGTDARAALAAEVFQIRDHVVSLANSQYQGRYIFHGARDDTPTYILASPSYANPATGPESQKYVFDNSLGATTTRTVAITDSLSVAVNTPGNSLFDTSIAALEKLGRSLSGYATGGGDPAYTFPTDYSLQTADIRTTIDSLDDARTQEIIPERVDLGGRLRRLETGENLLGLIKNTSEEVLDRLQNTDETESAANLAQAQTALQASYMVTSRVLKLSILDYI